MDSNQKWPDILWIVRHGESAGNVARDAAEAARLPMIDLAVRDCDVPLSELGKRQAVALGHWFADMDRVEQPTVVLSSPYLRARTTAQLVLEATGIDRTGPAIVIDERLREREFGVLDRLTRFGIEQRYPDQAEFRKALGKFYHRPPGGESWCDVILRLRSVIDTLTRDYCEERVLIVCHSVVVLCFKYLFERMTEDQILDVDRQLDIANCGVCSYEFDSNAGRKGKLVPRLFNFVAPLVETGTPVTTEKDVPVAPK